MTTAYLLIGGRKFSEFISTYVFGLRWPHIVEIRAKKSPRSYCLQMSKALVKTRFLPNESGLLKDARACVVPRTPAALAVKIGILMSPAFAEGFFFSTNRVRLPLSISAPRTTITLFGGDENKARVALKA